MIRTNRPRKLDLKWKPVGSGVYENEHGDRVHPGGLRILTADKNTSFAVNWSTDTVYHRCLDVMGGNRRRAIMLYFEYWRECNCRPHTPTKHTQPIR